MCADFDYASFPRRLNLGCGFDRRAGYLNVDFQPWHKPDLVADVGKLDRLPAGHYEEILANDVLEHLPRTSTRRILVHWNRLLTFDGVLRVRVPNAVAILELLKSAQHQSVAEQERLIQSLFGTQAYTGDFHYTSFTEVLLAHYLQVAGFRVLSINAIGDGNLEALARKVRNVNPRDVDDFSDLLQIGADDAFVRECYASILGRQADDEGAGFYVASLSEGRMTRDSVIDVLLNSEERKARTD
jgi:predicted SAM-dependent methyltransferase